MMSMCYPQQLACHPAHLPLLEAEETVICGDDLPEALLQTLRRLSTDFSTPPIPVVGDASLDTTTVEARLQVPEQEYVQYLTNQLMTLARQKRGGYEPMLLSPFSVVAQKGREKQ